MLGCVDGYDDGALDGEVEGISQCNIDFNIFQNKNDIEVFENLRKKLIIPPPDKGVVRKFK